MHPLLALGYFDLVRLHTTRVLKNPTKKTDHCSTISAESKATAASSGEGALFHTTLVGQGMLTGLYPHCCNSTTVGVVSEFDQRVALPVQVSWWDLSHR